MDLNGLMAGMEEAADEKHEKKPAKKKAEKKDEHHHHGGRSKHRQTVIDHHENGSHTIHHIAHPNADGTPGHNVEYAVPDLDGVHEGLEEHVGEPNPGEAEAEAGQSGIEGEANG